jgi:hypothetical protein
VGNLGVSFFKSTVYREFRFVLLSPLMRMFFYQLLPMGDLNHANKILKDTFSFKLLKFSAVSDKSIGLGGDPSRAVTPEKRD